MEYRKMLKKDLEQVVDVFVESYNDDVWKEKWSRDAAKRRLETLRNYPDSLCIVSLHENNVVGALFSSMLCWTDGIQVSINEIFVKEKYKGKNVGSRLIEKLFSLINKDISKEIILTTKKHPKLLGFYKKNGFEIDNELVYLKRKEN